MSKIHEFKNRQYKYNEDNSTLEYMIEGEVVFSLGLNILNWNENPDYWIEKIHNEIDEELKYELSFL